MTHRILTLAALTALTGTALLPLAAQAQTPAAPATASLNVVGTPDANFSTTNAGLIDQLAVAPDTAARQNLELAALAGNPANAITIMQMVTTQNPELAPTIFGDLLALLAQSSPAVVARLQELYPTLVADLASIQPAEGGSDTPEDLGNTTDNSPAAGDGLENPNQLSQNQ